jgi:hypothetical protein
MRARTAFWGWKAAWRERRHAAFWPDDEVSADEYVTELTSEPPAVPVADPRRRSPGRHRRGEATRAMMTVGPDDLRCTLEKPRAAMAPGQRPPWMLPSPAGRVEPGQLAQEPLRAVTVPASDPLPEPAAEPSPPPRRPGPPTVVFEVVRPNIDSDLGPYLASLPGYEDRPGAS